MEVIGEEEPSRFAPDGYARLLSVSSTEEKRDKQTLPLPLWGTQTVWSSCWGRSCRSPELLCTGSSSCQSISLHIRRPESTQLIHKWEERFHLIHWWMLMLDSVRWRNLLKKLDFWNRNPCKVLAPRPEAGTTGQDLWLARYLQA